MLGWRQEVEHYYGIPAGGELCPGALVAGVPENASVCHCGCPLHPASRLGAQVSAEGLHVVEDFAVENGGIGVINVCLDKEDAPGYRSVSLNRLYNRVNATAAQERGYAFLIFGQEPDDMEVRTYERLRNHNPVPVRVGDGWHTRNLPIDRVIGGPTFRIPDADHLLQVAGLVAHALLWREEPQDDDGFAGAFGVLDRALNRRASRNDPQGVVRR